MNTDANTTTQRPAQEGGILQQAGYQAAGTGSAATKRDPQHAIGDLARLANSLRLFNYSAIAHQIDFACGSLAAHFTPPSPDPQQDHARLPRGARSVADETRHKALQQMANSLANKWWREKRIKGCEFGLEQEAEIVTAVEQVLARSEAQPQQNGGLSDSL